MFNGHAALNMQQKLSGENSTGLVLGCGEVDGRGGEGTESHSISGSSAAPP